MQVLARTPDQHEPVADRNPFLKPSHRTCLQVAGLQEHATTPSGSVGVRESARQALTVPSITSVRESCYRTKERKLIQKEK